MSTIFLAAAIMSKHKEKDVLPLKVTCRIIAEQPQKAQSVTCSRLCCHQSRLYYFQMNSLQL